MEWVCRAPERGCVGVWSSQCSVLVGASKRTCVETESKIREYCKRRSREGTLRHTGPTGHELPLINYSVCFAQSTAVQRRCRILWA